MTDLNLLSVVIPLYKSQSTIWPLYHQLRDSLQDIDFEVIFVDDSSPDDSWNIVEELSAKYDNVRGIKLSRNFGQQIAITAGLNYSLGDYVVVMDADLQDSPKDIVLLLQEQVSSGADVVFARRASRNDSYFKKVSSKLYWRIFNTLSGTDLDDQVGTFGIYSRRVVNHLNNLTEQNRSFVLLVSWLSFPTSFVEVERKARASGSSSYSLKKLISLGFEGIVSHSDNLLKLSSGVGVIFSLSSFLISIFYLIRYLFIGDAPEGWTSLLLLSSFSTGLILIFVGILGIYISQVFEEVKKRPIYLVTQTIGTKS